MKSHTVKGKDTMVKERKHKHIWKYECRNVRICEAPFPTIESCGEEQWNTAFGGWHKAEDIIKSRNEI